MKQAGIESTFNFEKATCFKCGEKIWVPAQ